MKKLNEVRQSIEQFGRKTIDGSTEKLNEVGQTVRERVVDTTTVVRWRANRIGCISQEKLSAVVDKTLKEAQKVVGTANKKLSNLNLKQVEWIVRAQVVGSVTAAMPLALKDLPAVAKSLANRAGGISPDQLFDQIPIGARLTEESIKKFLKTHDVSHRISIKNAPTKSGDIDNIIFESFQKNRARGSKNMTWTEFQRAQLNNTVASIKYGFKTAAGTAAKGALFGALLELPVTVIENTLHVKNNRKSVENARIDAAKDIGISAGFAGATAAAFTGLSLLGVTLGPAAIPLAIVGGVMYTWSATDRIWKALDDKTKERLINSEPVLFLASVARCEDNQDYISSLKMLPEK